MAKFWLSKSIFYVKKYPNISKKKNSLKNMILGAHFLLLTFFENFNFWWLLLTWMQDSKVFKWLVVVCFGPNIFSWISFILEPLLYFFFLFGLTIACSGRVAAANLSGLVAKWSSPQGEIWARVFSSLHTFSLLKRGLFFSSSTWLYFCNVNWFGQQSFDLYRQLTSLFFI